MATLECSRQALNKITPSKTPTEAVCLIQWTEKDGSTYSGTGFLAIDQLSPKKQVYLMSAGHNFRKLDIVNPELSEEKKISLRIYNLEKGDIGYDFCYRK